ncbi:FAD-dependent oxidoreductase [Streptomyces winkii]|uniref:FAD-dependent oxidoreductase n=1 Tax=Streptomyces winkii TaxID=3051178 RepID=UPI0028D662DA|nr:FAD-dependent oxidoreductase [Streptomyces sp. DSM 40971]
MSDWVRVAELTELSRRKKKLVQVGEERIALFFAGGEVFALRDTCVHKERRLSDGTLLGGRVVCPGHQWAFDLSTGQADGRDECQPTYPVKTENGQVWVRPEPRRSSAAAAATVAATAAAPVPRPTGERRVPERILIAGAGQTGAVAARTLRRHGFGGGIVLVGEEPHAPYQRPPLTKEFLAGREGRTDLALLTREWCEEHDVELRLGTAVRRIHPGDGAPGSGDASGGFAELEDGSRLHADAFLLATGARARRLPGIEGERVVHLRRLEDAERLRAHIRPGARVVVIGAGFVGSEVASTALAAGAGVVVLEQGRVPLERALGARMGEVCARVQRKAGVELHTGQTVTSYEETAGGAVVSTAEGLRVEGDVVVVAAGAVPETGIAERSGIAVSDGVLVDEYCRTNVPGVYAAGDVANQQHPLYGRRLRVEHFDNASRQAATAARNMLGEAVVHDDPHWFWSDQFELNLQQCGHTEGTDRVVVRGSAEAADFTAFYLADGVLRAAFTIGRGGDVLAAKDLIARRAAPEPEVLCDEDTDLAGLAADTGGLAEAREAGARDEDSPGSDSRPLPPSARRPAPPEAAPGVPYIRVARSGQVPEGIVRRFFVDDVELAVARRDGAVHVSSNYCTHLDCLLSSGKVTREGLLCSCHGSVFDFATGEPLSPPATEPIRVHPSKEENGEILVALDPDVAPHRRKR